MHQPFEITFEYTLDESRIILVLRATVEYHSLENYYHIHSFHSLLPDAHPSVKNSLSLLPNQDLISSFIGSTKRWLHKDSEKESQLSRIIGKAIDDKIDKETISN